MSKQEKLAKVIRVITVPPILVAIMLLVLYWRTPYIFGERRNLLMSLLWLGVFPILAYPLQPLLPKWKNRGREGQRNLAFVCSAMGYFVAVIYGLIVGASKELQLVYDTYALSVLILIILNKVCKKKASGHACSITGPLIFLIYFINWKMALICIPIGGMSFWASIKLNRHSPKELFLGSASCIVSFGIAIAIRYVC